MGSDEIHRLRPGIPNVRTCHPRTLDRLLAVVAVACAMLLSTPRASAQQRSPWDLREGLPAGTELEGYLRTLQVAGLAPWYPWTVRGFTAGELPRITPQGDDHPWRNRYDFAVAPPDTPEWGLVRPEAQIFFNSAYPFGENDGAVWVGKGVTGVVRGGAFLRWGRLHVRIAPEAFWAQNADFVLADNGLTGEEAFRDGRTPAFIDLPQRFGGAARAYLSLGSTEISVRLPGIAVGISGAAQVWGPAQHYPLLLGTNAGGFPHAFVQTSHPVDVGLGALSGRLVVGRLTQSEWSPVTSGEERRFVSAAALVLNPRGIPGLELGVHRLVHGVWPAGGPNIDQILRPFSGGVSVGFAQGQNLREENQLAGAFLRWSFPSVGFEAFLELVRDDFGRDVRHYLMEPDDIMGRTLGLRRLLQVGKNRLLAIRGEVVSAEAHHSERGDRFRDGREVWPLPLYWNGGVRQGHTQRGQLLASPAAYGGSAWTVGVDLFTPDGRKTLDLFRGLRQDWLASLPPGGTNIADVVYGIRFEQVRFGNGFELTTTVVPSVNLNRNVVRRNDVFNLNVAVGVRGLPW